MAKLFGVTRAQLWRWELMAAIPEELFDLLLKQRPMLTTKSLAQVGLALRSGQVGADVEKCPHCGGLLRIRKASIQRRSRQ